jgi:hypothetical protein
MPNAAALKSDPAPSKARGAFYVERVTWVSHWTSSLFSLRTTRDPGLRFASGQFVMLGLEVEGRPLLRAYSIASAAWADELEFYSIKVRTARSPRACRTSGKATKSWSARSPPAPWCSMASSPARTST